jgi:hypothetical protein
MIATMVNVTSSNRPDDEHREEHPVDDRGLHEARQQVALLPVYLDGRDPGEHVEHVLQEIDELAGQRERQVEEREEQVLDGVN